MSSENAYFAGGCFWCMEPPFEALDGVIEATSGYMGGDVENPTYEQVTTGQTGHAEVVEIVFDPEIVSYEELLEVFWRNIDPTALNYQFADVGSQYRTEIFTVGEEQNRLAQESKVKLEESGKFDKPIVTAISPALSAEITARDPHKADAPILVILFIVNSFFINIHMNCRKNNTARY